MLNSPPAEADIFQVAEAISSAAARNTYLDQACAGDEELRKRVVALLQIAEEERSFLERPAAEYVETIGRSPITEKAGDTIGPYKLMEQIGEGGFGLVFVAEQQVPVRRKVALKVIKPGMDTREVVARFEAERQALAMMEHPHIAKVLDAGTTDSGRPFFVMELVRGVPITEYCDANQLSPRERLPLFIAVCQAVQHAHQKGVIHRDLKPSNILVAPHDGIPVVKVIDFGIAKALGQQLTDKTIYTRFAQMVGTPLYMSPEQAEINALDVDTRSDIYALGVLLYELITGTTPFDKQRLNKAAFDEIRRIIREEEPPKPSTRISTLGMTLDDVSAKRKTDPGRLSKEVRGDLDWIVMKCLEKDRTRRYETANGLVRDIERFLKDEPVEACQPSPLYRVQKFIRRNRVACTTGMLIATSLLGGILISVTAARDALYQRRLAEESLQVAFADRQLAEQAQKNTTAALREVERERDRAEKAQQEEASQRRRADAEAAAARAVRDFLQDDLLRQASIIHQIESSSVFQDGTQFLRNPTINELLDRAAAELAVDKIDARFKDLPFVQAEVLKAVGDGYVGVAPAKAIEPLERAALLYRQSRGADDPVTLAARHSLAVAHFMNRQDAEAAQQLKEVYTDRVRVLGPAHLDTFLTRDYLGRTYLASKNPQGIPFFKQVLSDARQHLGPDHIETLKAQFHLGCALTYAGRFDEGIREFEAGQAAGKRLNLRSDHPYQLTVLYEVGSAYKAAGKNRQAVELLEKCLQLAEQQKLGAYGIWLVQHNLGWTYLAEGRRDDAIKAFKNNLELQPQDTTTMEALGWALRTVDLERSIGLYQQACKVRHEQHGPDDPVALRIGRSQAMVLRLGGKRTEALVLLDQIIPALERVQGPDHVETVKARAEKARSLAALGEHSAAVALFEANTPRLENLLGPKHADVLSDRRSWILAVLNLRQYDRAVALAAELVDRRRQAAAGSPTSLAADLIVQGRSLVNADRAVEAVPRLREALAIYVKETPQSWNTAQSKYWLAIALSAEQQYAEAEALFIAAYAEFTEQIGQTPTWGRSHRGDALQRLVALYEVQDKRAEAAKWQKISDDLNTAVASPLQ